MWLFRYELISLCGNFVMCLIHYVVFLFLRYVMSMRPWTANIFCLADRLQSSIPSTITNKTLHNAELGLKKIKFQLTDNEEQVAEKNMSEESCLMGRLSDFLYFGMVVVSRYSTANQIAGT